MRAQIPRVALECAWIRASHRTRGAGQWTDRNRWARGRNDFRRSGRVGQTRDARFDTSCGTRR